MTDTEIEVHKVGHMECDGIGAMIAEAFIDLAPSVWLHTNEMWRARVFPKWFAMQARTTVDVGTLYLTHDRAGAAFWLPSEAPAAHGELERLTELVGQSEVGRFQLFDELLGAAHPQGPHEWLAVMGVRPSRQNEGLGTVMLRHHMRDLDRRGVVGYLEAANEADAAFYAHRGWDSFGPAVLLPADPERGVPHPVPLFPMTYQPK